MTANRPRFLMCPPTHFRITEVQNPWMRGQIGRTEPARLMTQWEALRAALAEHADVETVEPDEKHPHLAAVGAAALVAGKCAAVSSESDGSPVAACLRAEGFGVTAMPTPLLFDGAVDAISDAERGVLWAMGGHLTSLEAHRHLAETLGVEVISLHSVDPRFHHLAMVLCPLPGGHLLCHPGAFDSHSLREIERLVPKGQRLAVEEEDALRFSINAVVIGDTLITTPLRDGLRTRLRERGIDAVEIDLSEFHRAGISARDLCLRLDEGRPGPGKAVCHLASEEVEFQGHLINTGLMAKMLDLITDNGCSFDIIRFAAGQRPEDPSVARLRVTAPRPAVLQSIVAQIKARGGETDGAEREAHLVEVEQDGVAPPDFLVTTIYPTDVLVDGQWIEVEQRRMDATVVIDKTCDPPRALARLMRDVRKGELVVCGHEGVRVRVPEETTDGKEDFAFMSSSVSSERRVEIEVERIAWEMRRIRDRGGKIVVVPGPVVIHTGGGPHLASLIREGYIQGLLGGNAIAAHDIEQSIYSTSLGVDLRSGHVVEGGHRHHLRVINEVRRHGSIAAAVDAGFIKTGVMHACVTAGIPFVLAGSIRDDGPLPDTVMDLIEGQRLYQEQVRGAEMILMLSTMLHAIGTGNMTPSGVRLICVDISPAVVTKLADRGSLESVGIVTDVGLFLSMLCNKLGLIPERERVTR